ncbi:hypothetical protein M655_004195 [Brevibacillus sp. NSP2.1]|nr:hypothetical protein [Brevibacillus sp. NSP2.1]QHZ54918.1 hypothetical protein M655_004195 [Brevibacillus sp. NSP2.1]
MLQKAHAAVGHIYTLVVVLIGWVFFECESLPVAWQFLRAMSGFAGQGFMDDQALYYWSTKGAFYAYQALARQMGLEPQNEADFRLEAVSDAFSGSLYSKSGYRLVQPDSIELYVPRAAQTYSVEFVDEQRRFRQDQAQPVC